MNWEQVTHDKRVKIEKDIAKIANKFDNNKLPKVGIKTKIIFNMMSKMQKSGWGSSPIEKQYWQENGWLEKQRPWDRAYRDTSKP